MAHQIILIPRSAVFSPPAGLTVDEVGIGIGATGDGPHTWDHTLGSGSNRAVFVVVSSGGTGGRNDYTVTFNGQAMSEVSGADHIEFATSRMKIFVRKESDSGGLPAAGTYTVSVTPTNNLPCLLFHGNSISFLEVNQTTPAVNGTNVEANSGNDWTIVVNSSPGHIVLAGVNCAATNTSQISSQNTERWEEYEGSFNTTQAGATASGSSPNVSMSWNLSSTPIANAVGCSIQPA